MNTFAKIDKVINQNKMFAHLMVAPAPNLPEINYGEIYIEAFIIDPKRCFEFSTQPSALNDSYKPPIRNFILQNVFQLLNINQSENRKLLLKTIFAPLAKDSAIDKNIELILRILDKIPMNGIQKVDDEVISFFKDTFINIAIPHNELQEKLSALQQQLLQSSKEAKLKENIYQAINLALYPEHIDRDSRVFKQHYLEQLIANQPEDQEAKANTLKEFINICETTPAENIEEALANIDDNELNKLINFDISTNKTWEVFRRSSLSNTHRYAIFKHYFNAKTIEDQDKALLLTNIFGNKKIAELFFDPAKTNPLRTSFVNNYLYHTFIPKQKMLIFTKNYNYQELKNALETIRQAAIANGEYENATLLDQPLQTILQTKTEKPHLQATN